MVPLEAVPLEREWGAIQAAATVTSRVALAAYSLQLHGRFVLCKSLQFMHAVYAVF